MIKINILFWGDEKERLANTSLSWHYLKDFCKFANDNGLEIESYLFDMSEQKQLAEAIHIPFPNNTFRKSEKINKIIDYHGEYDGIFSLVDSDVVIDPKDYGTLIYLLKKIKKNEFYVFGLNDLNNTNGVNFETKEVDFKSIEYTSRVFDPDLGALFFIDSKVINENRFPETFTVWGGEDNILAKNIMSQGFKKRVIPVVPYHLPHKHALTEKDIEQYNKQVKILNSI